MTAAANSTARKRHEANAAGAAATLTDAESTALQDWPDSYSLIRLVERIKTEAVKAEGERIADDLIIEADNTAPDVPNAYQEGVVDGLRSAASTARGGDR